MEVKDGCIPYKRLSLSEAVSCLFIHLVFVNTLAVIVEHRVYVFVEE